MNSSRYRSGTVTLELVIAMGILTSTLLPVAYSIVQEQRLARSYYYRAVALEIVDGEMEILASGGWQAFSPGRHTYPVHAEAAKNLPPGEFVLEIRQTDLRLEWRPLTRNKGGVVTRTSPLPGPAPAAVQP